VGVVDLREFLLLRALSACDADVLHGRHEMTLCPIAIAVGCKKCPAFNICPLKSVIGDYKRQDEQQMPSGVDKTNGDK
jgi:hypothetical protein